MMGEVIRVSGRAPDVGDLLREAMVSQRFADVALCCSGGQKFLAHRLVLSAASPYLQDVLLAHSKAAGYSEPITIILAEVEGPELSAILGFVYTGSATIPKSRLEAFTRAAETLHVTIPAFPAPSTTEFSNCETLTPSRNNDDDLNLDNVKIEETTRRNDKRYLGCEQYPSYDGWLNSSSWHFHDDCSKRYYQPDDWIITRNDALSRSIHHSPDDIARFHRSYIDTRNNIHESDKSFKENENKNDRIDFPNENDFRTNKFYGCEINREKINCQDDTARKKFYKEKQLARSAPWLENHPTISNSYDSFVESSTILEHREDKRNYDFPPEIQTELRCFDDKKIHSYSTSDDSVSRMNLDSSRRYDEREEKDPVDNNFEGSPENERVMSSLLSHSTTGRSSITFEKQDYNYSPTISATSRIAGGSSTTVILGAKIVSETAVTSTVTSDLTTNFANSTLLRTNGDLCGESCCRWRTPKRHVANRVPASPWCQLARPAHHSPKTRPIILRNREESFETPSNDNWHESVQPSEIHANTFPPMSMTYIDNKIENSSSLSVKVDGNVNNDSSGLIYGYQVPKTTEDPSSFQENSNYTKQPHNQNFYVEKSNKNSSVFSTTPISSMEQFPTIITSTEVIRPMENSQSMINIGRDPSQLRQIDRASNIIVNHEQSRVRVSQHAISPEATNKQIIIDPSTCNLQLSTKVELSHPISRLCDTAHKTDETISQDTFSMEKNIEKSINTAEIREIETKDEDLQEFREKSIFSISNGIVQSDDNNNEAGIDESVVENVRNVNVNSRDINEIIIGEDGGINNEEHRCDQCGKTFVTRASLKVHGRTHSGEKPFRCNDCGKEFSQLRNYKYHRSVHEGTREFAATCPECGKYFNDRGYLSSHMKIHRNRKEYACSECGKSFNQRVAYNMHVRIHTGIKPHQCEQCGKAFSRKMLLKQHLRTHSGERPYQCQICHKAFADRSNMTLHTRLHSGLKPYQCTLCTKAFTKKHHLKTHLNYHTGTKPYACPNCSLRFSQSSNMRTHYKKCCSIVEIDPSKRENSTSRGRNKEQSTAPSSDSLVVSRVVVTPSVGGRTNALTPPNSDQESSIHTPIKINDVLLHSTTRGNNLNKDSTNVPDT